MANKKKTATRARIETRGDSEFPGTRSADYRRRATDVPMDSPTARIWRANPSPSQGIAHDLRYWNIDWLHCLTSDPRDRQCIFACIAQRSEQKPWPSSLWLPCIISHMGTHASYRVEIGYYDRQMYGIQLPCRRDRNATDISKKLPTSLRYHSVPHRFHSFSIFRTIQWTALANVISAFKNAVVSAEKPKTPSHGKKSYVSWIFSISTLHPVAPV